MDKKWYLYSNCNSSHDSISNFQNCRWTITMAFIVVYPLTSIDDYSDIQCHLSIDFDRQCHRSSMLSMIVDNLFRSLSFVSVVSVVNVIDDRRRSSMSSMIPVSFHVVCSCTQQGQGDFLDVWIRKWCRTKLQSWSVIFSSYFATSKEYQQILLRTYFS